jgi:hypothetical protein
MKSDTMIGLFQFVVFVGVMILISSGGYDMGYAAGVRENCCPDGDIIRYQSQAGECFTCEYTLNDSIFGGDSHEI